MSDEQTPGSSSEDRPFRITWRTNLESLLTTSPLLISNGHMMILSGNAAGSPATVPKPIPGCNLKNLHTNEISLLTKKASGALIEDPKGWSIPKLVLQREFGFRTGRGFSKEEICKIGTVKLPFDRMPIGVYTNKAFCAVYSPDGERLVTACQDRKIRVYSTSGTHYQCSTETVGRDVGWSMLDLAFSPDGRSIAYSSWSNNLHLAKFNDDLKTHTPLPLCPDERRFCVFNISFSANGDEVLCGANDGNLYIYDLFSNKTVLKVKAHSDDANAVTFADIDSHIIYSGGDDAFCKVWDRRTLNEKNPKPVGILAGHLDGITYIDSRKDGRYFISNSKDQSIKLWDIRHFSTGIGMESTKLVMATHKWDYRWQRAPKKLINRKSNMDGDTSVATYRGHSVLQTLIRSRFSPAFSTGQRYIYTGCAFGRVVVYDILTGDITKTYNGHASCVRDVCWHPHRSEIVSASWDFLVAVWGHFGAHKSDLPESERPQNLCTRRSSRRRSFLRDSVLSF